MINVKITSEPLSFCERVVGKLGFSCMKEAKFIVATLDNETYHFCDEHVKEIFAPSISEYCKFITQRTKKTA